MLRKIGLTITLLFITICSFAQDAVVYGTVKDEAGNIVELATVAIQNTSIGTITDPDGKFKLSVPTDKRYILVVSFGSLYTTYKKSLSLTPGQQLEVKVELKSETHVIDEVTIKNKTEVGMVQFNTTAISKISGPQDGVTAIIKSLVGTNNELTSQYTVRGGNYDENLVYVNDFEIYRPFLTRSGQQEGLSFVNGDLVSNVNFSVGGFQSKYGDKMSSVLDVSYKHPTKFAGSVALSMLGLSLHLEGASKNQKLTYLFGARQKSNQYLLQSQPTKGVYQPSFTDIQFLANYQANEKWEWEVIANYARNRFNFVPEEQTSSFGVVNQAYQLQVFYDGSETDKFDSRFGGISTTYKPNKKLKLKLLASGFQTDERETYDIGGEYLLGELETDLGKENFGQIKTYLGTGIIQTHARNYLNVNVGTLAHRGTYTAKKHALQWGADGMITSITDKLHEWERRDSAGFSQPYSSNEVNMRYFYKSSSTFDYSRVSAFIQDNFRFSDSLDLTLNIGVRVNYNFLNNEFIASPRGQLAYRPKNSNVIFRAAAGVYAQPPFYREMRDLNGVVNKNLKAQKSAHFVLGGEYNFEAFKKPFKITAEVYYKNLWDLVPYEYDNVRIRYFGQNIAKGYAYGGEVRFFGDIVKNATSWISIGLLKTEEDISNDQVVYKNTAGADSATFSPGYVPRPTDQRFMVGMYFEDYLPRNKNFKMHLNLMYASGLPFGPPDQKRYGDTLRLPDYKRVDIGFSALLLDGAKKERPAHSFFRSFQSIWLSLEVFNLLGIQNTLSYSWIQDQTSGGTYAVPNRLTSRLINAKLIFRF
jgi:hypothetical protein